MTRLVYLSPVPWASFEQRPHKFVSWFHAKTGAEVLWIDPYAARFPRVSDLVRWRRGSTPTPTPAPAWLRVLRPMAAPIEPLPAVAHANRVFWSGLIDQIRRFAREEPALLVLGKPSLLALQVLAALPSCASIYDAMDDFPSFHEGLTRRTMHARERQIVSRVSTVWASSRTLQQRLAQQRGDVQLVPNGLDLALMPSAKNRRHTTSLVFGYVGTIANWFDWDLVVALALARPWDRIRLIGPMDSQPSVPLPANIEVLPARPHAEALEAMREFDVGLIPFKRNSLTDGVDPIKYYEYRALGLAVLSTNFGEMSRRRGEPGVYLVGCNSDLAAEASKAAVDDSCLAPDFARQHCWTAVFDAATLPLLAQACSDFSSNLNF